jgi:threonine/homoserine/homoserine lactone efflux protein
MSAEVYAAYLAACLIVVLVPGPSVALIVANSIRHGTRAGLLNVLGGQIGIACTILVVAIGLTSLIESMGHWFDWLRLAGAAYLVWLGWKMIRACDAGGKATVAKPPRAAATLSRVLSLPSATPRP